ncbi:uncharacterized protein LOC120134243 [Hibiscus syriacus]|uniref:uncharacterized protein LOC120134243 n=1 Tax=Hibiscus syriacus TaxID=106335 RepID=UPI001921ADEA|nr:uncharacterized protein LOC120134243 [Hibiscus syriacus]
MFSGFELGNQERLFMLSHLQFADDLIIFSKATVRDLKNVRRVLLIFELMTGLQLNLSKSKIFGINVDTDELAGWAVEIGCTVGFFPAEYLGLPLGSKRNSAVLWEPIVQRFYSKLAGWKANSLSLAGRAVLVKIPIGVVKRLNSIMAAFLWGGSADKRNIHWLNWKGKVAEFMENSSSGCCWDIKLRRNLVNWEVEQWMQLMSLLNSTSLSSLQEDCWVWTGNGEGCFSAKSCVKCYFDWAGNEEDDGTWDSIVWTGVAPPRVETFVWQAAHQRVAVREELIKRGVTGIEDSLCPLCGKCVESVSHLFVHCEVVRGLWYKFLSSWNVSFVPPQTLLDFIIVWNDLIPKSTI